MVGPDDLSDPPDGNAAAVRAALRHGVTFCTSIREERGRRMVLPRTGFDARAVHGVRRRVRTAVGHLANALVSANGAPMILVSGILGDVIERSCARASSTWATISSLDSGYPGEAHRGRFTMVQSTGRFPLLQ